MQIKQTYSMPVLKQLLLSENNSLKASNHKNDFIISLFYISLSFVGTHLSIIA